MAIYLDRKKPNSGLANFLATRGRHGDTELVHMTKPEVKRLMNTGLMTLNPRTGLPEMFLGSVFKGLKNYAKNFLKPKNLIPSILGTIGGAYLGPIIGNAAPLLRGAASTALGRGAGVFAGSLPFRGLEGSATAGATTGLTSYLGSKLSDVFRPGPQAYGIKPGGRSGLYGERITDALKKGAATQDITFEEFDEIGTMDVLPDDVETMTSGRGTLQFTYPGTSTPIPIRDRPWGPAEIDMDYGPRHDATVYSPTEAAEMISKVTNFKNPNLFGGQQIPALNPKPVQQFIKGLNDQERVNKFMGLNAKGIKNLLPNAEIATIDDVRGWVNRPPIEQKLKAYEFAGLAPSDATKMQIARESAAASGKFIPEKVLHKALDPWYDFNNQGLAQLKNLNMEGFKTLPISDALAGMAAGMEGVGAADAAEAEEEYMKDVERQLTQPRFYSPTRNNVRYFARAQPTPYGRIPIRRADEGGLVTLAHGGDMRKDFEGLVQGRGHGMQDNVIMDIKQKGGLLAVSPKEYVVPADVMANLGNGNPDAGAEHMDKFISDFRKKKYGRDKQPPEMDGATALQSLMA